MSEYDAPGLGRSDTTTTTTTAAEVLLLHVYHDCEEGQNTAACGHRFCSDEDVDPCTAQRIENCGVCMELVRLPCARCTA